MSLGADIGIEGWLALLDINGTELLVMGPGGGAVNGLLQTAPPIEPGMELGTDLRELSLFEIMKPLPGNIQFGTRLRDNSTGALWKTVKREDNPADFTGKFWLAKVTEGDNPQ